MSMAPLLGIPGKVKTVLDRLTATRAGNLDNLDATVSSRAPSSTALSTATWTNGRAAALDTIATTDATVTRIEADTQDIQTTVNAITVAAITRHAEVTVSGNGSTTNFGVNLGATFDIGKSQVQIGDLYFSTSSLSNKEAFFKWQTGSQLRVSFRSPATGALYTPASSESFKVTVVEFIQ